MNWDHLRTFTTGADHRAYRPEPLPWSFGARSLVVAVSSDLPSFLPMLPMGELAHVVSLQAVSNFAFLDVFLQKHQPACILMDLAGLGEINEAVDALLQFRRRHGSVPVVLCSRDFSASESSTERKFLCDYSLKLPASFTGVLSAMNEAVAFNRHNMR